MKGACLPIEIPNKLTGKWTADSRLRWLKWLLEFQRMEVSRLPQSQQNALCENIVKFCCSYPFGAPQQSTVPRSERMVRLDSSVVKPKIRYLQNELR